jgi:hypothetical protein
MQYTVLTMWKDRLPHRGTAITEASPDRFYLGACSLEVCTVVIDPTISALTCFQIHLGAKDLMLTSERDPMPFACQPHSRFCRLKQGSSEFTPLR